MASSTVDMSFHTLWEIVKDRGAWLAAIHAVAKSRTGLSNRKTTTKTTLK